MFKWVCLMVAVVALSAFGWMVNDIRLEIKSLVPKVEQLTEKTEQLVEKTNSQLPRILAQAELATAQIDTHLPRILVQADQASKTLNSHLPILLTRSEVLLVRSELAVDNLIDLSDNFKQYKGLMGVVHVATQNKGLFSYGSSILGFLAGHDAHIGVKAAGPGQGLKQAVPAKEWARAAAGDAHFLSLVGKTKDDMLHGLAKTKSPAPLHIQFPGQPTRLLADWLRETHPESKAP